MHVITNIIYQNGTWINNCAEDGIKWYLSGSISPVEGPFGNEGINIGSSSFYIGSNYYLNDTKDYTISFWNKNPGSGCHILWTKANGFISIRYNYNESGYCMRVGDSYSYFRTTRYSDNVYNGWHYIALTNKNSTKYFFVDGLLQGTGNFQFIFSNIAGYEGRYAGYIDDFTIIDDTCLWTSDFSVPTKYIINLKDKYKLYQQNEKLYSLV